MHHYLKRQKISAALIELVYPSLYSSPHPELDEAKTIVGLGALAWNLSLLAKPERVQQLSRMLQDPNITDPEFLMDVVQDLIARKLELFPHDTRFIIGWEVQRTRRNSFHVTAMCTG